MQLAAFIDRSSAVTAAGRANRNLYYIVSFSNTVRDTSGTIFLTNDNRRVSRLVLQRFVYRRGTLNLAVALNNLAARFKSLSAAASASAVVLTGGTSARTAAVTAARGLRTSFASRVAIASIALTPRANIAVLEGISSIGIGGQRLVFQTSVSTRVESLLASSISSAGASASRFKVFTVVFELLQISTSWALERCFTPWPCMQAAQPSRLPWTRPPQFQRQSSTPHALRCEHDPS